MKSISIVLYWLSLAMLIVGCHPMQSTQQPVTGPMPETYRLQTDTVNAADIQWREYFSDTLLVSLIDEALHRNYDAQIALQRIEQAAAESLFRKGLLMPKVDGMATSAVRRYGLYTMDGAGNSTTDILPGQVVPTNLPDYLVGFQASWEVDVAGKLRNRKKAAMARYLASIEGKNWLYTNLIAQVAYAYYDLLALDQELEIIRSTVAIQQNALEVVTMQMQAGLANDLAVKQFQAQLLNTRNLEKEIRQLIIVTESIINGLLGRYPQPVLRAASSFDGNNIEQLQAGLPADLIQNRPDIRQAEMEVQAAKADLAAAKAAFYPSLNVIGSIGYQAFQTNLSFTTPESFIFTLIGNLSAPFINRSAIKSEFKAANAYQVEALLNYQKSLMNAFLEVFVEINNLQNLNEMVDQKTQEATILTESISTSNELFKTGRANYIELLITQQNALNARLDLIDLKRRTFNGRVNLYKVLGGGWN
jgi:NodT family efflux transporter outer membrane factor (OMF) lipoprotein